MILSKIYGIPLFKGQIRDLLNQYILDSTTSHHEYAKALAEFSSIDESTLNFKKGEIIAVVPKKDAYTEKVNILKMSDSPGTSDLL